MKRLEVNNDGKVLGFGEVMLRLTPPCFQKVIQANSFDATYAGGEANVICSLSMFGHDTKFVTKVPDNTLGEKVIRDLNSFGIYTKEIIKGEGRLGIYFLEQGNGLRNSDVTYDRKYSAISLAKRNEFNIEEMLNDVKLIHVSGINPALSKEIKDLTLEIAKEAKKRNIVVSYDSNFRSKLWSLEEAREFMLEILPFVDIVFLGILDFKNILEYEVDEGLEFEDCLTSLYKKLFDNYPNLQYASCTKRKVNTVNNNSLQGFLFDGEKLNKSKLYTFDILDRVGGGDSYTAGILHGLLKNLNNEDVVEFATCASVLKHSIQGDINLVCLDDVETLMTSGLQNIKR